MTKSIQQIKQELQNLESTTAETASELEKLYQDYLSLLGKSVKQQLILAGYQICTQFYPQSFLKLSLGDKQELQQTLIQIGLEVKPALLSIVEHKELEPEPRKLNLMEELIKKLPKSLPNQPDSEIELEVENEDEIAEIDLATVKAELEKIEFIEIDDSSEVDSNSEEGEAQVPNQEMDVKNPQHLILWHKQIERGIKKTLEYTSQKANKRLQDSQVIPNRIPNKIIEVAIQADSSQRQSDRRLQNTPNILSLAVESTGDSKKSKSKSAKNMLHVSLLRLRLTELEFCDPILNAKRGKIRNLVSKINQLKNRYKAIKHEASIAEAQAAWRSSWYED